MKVVPRGWNDPISAQDLSIGERTAIAIAAAILTAVVAALLANAVMESTHFLCEWETGDQEAGNHWACPSYFVPLATVAGGAAGAVLLTYVAFELWLSSRSVPRDLRRERNGSGLGQRHGQPPEDGQVHVQPDALHPTHT